MIDLSKEIPNENLTQKDIMQFLLHSTQHVATREELKDVKDDLSKDIEKVDDKISKLATKEELAKVESSLRADIVKLDQKIDKVDGKFDRLQWLIIATIATVLLKDYIIGLIN